MVKKLNFRVTEITLRRSKDRIPVIFLERPAVVQAIGHTLHLPVAGRGIESHDSASAKTGGIKGGLGLAEDTSDAAISCQQIGPVELSDAIKAGKAQGDVVFKKRTSLVFKKLQVVRFYDAKRNTLAYLAYSHKLVDGSPKNAISAVPLIPWK